MDFNVAAVSLSVPPVPAYLTTYRPAVSVLNNGIHDADVTGVLRIYDRTTGLMIWSAPLAAVGVPPGETRDAIASLYWTPDHVGDYLVQGFVTTDRDQNPDDNQLASVTVPVSAEPPPPPPTVPIHATQHEAAGTDPLNVAGLHGRLADTQSPTSHASSHGPAGSDVLSVEGLHGRLADAQAVENHGNDEHTPAMATASELLAHDQDTAAHILSSNLEHTSRRGAANGYPALDAAAMVPVDQLATGSGEVPGASAFLRLDRTWQIPPSGRPGLAALSGVVSFNSSGPQNNVIVSTVIPAGQIVLGSVLEFECGGEVYLELPHMLLFYVMARPVGGLWDIIAQSVAAATGAPLPQPKWFDFRARVQFIEGTSPWLRRLAAGVLLMNDLPVPVVGVVSTVEMVEYDPAVPYEFAIAPAISPILPEMNGTAHLAYIGQSK